VEDRVGSVASSAGSRLTRSREVILPGRHLKLIWAGKGPLHQ
jgi:hypothetical protein